MTRSTRSKGSDPESANADARCESLAPVTTHSVRVLILGSMPGAESLRRAEYYAHPRNLFWDFIEELLAIPRTLPYRERLRRLNRSGVALWDVVAQCRRRGSLDAAIERTTVIPNDFAGLFPQLPALRTIGFNGRAAADLYARLVLPQLDARWQRIERIELPSTSPANASIPRPDKRAQWQRLFTPTPTRGQTPSPNGITGSDPEWGACAGG